MMTLCFFVVLLLLSFDSVFSRQSFFSVSSIVLELTVDQAAPHLRSAEIEGA